MTTKTQVWIDTDAFGVTGITHECPECLGSGIVYNDEELNDDEECSMCEGYGFYCTEVE